MPSVQLPPSLTYDKADKLAADIEPSWFEHLGAPPIAAGPEAVTAQKRIVSIGDSTPAPAAKSPARARTGGARSARRPRVAAAEPIETPTEGGNAGKIFGILAAAAVVIGIVVWATGGDDTETGKSTAAPPQATQAKQPAAPKTPDPAPETKTAADPPAPEPEPETTAEPEPVAAPDPPPQPKPVAVAPPRPFPKAAPTPKPKSKKKKKKSSGKPAGGDIVRDAPF